MNTKQCLAGILHCTAKIPRTTGSMPPSVCLAMNLNKWKFRAGWFPLQYASCLQRALNVCQTLTRPGDTEGNTTHSWQCPGCQRRWSPWRARDGDTKLLWHAAPPVSDQWSPLSRCHEALPWLTDAVSPSDWSVSAPSRPLIGPITDHSPMIVISWVTFGHQVIPDRSFDPDYPVSEEDQTLEPLSRTHHTPILELNRKPDNNIADTWASNTTVPYSTFETIKHKHGLVTGYVCSLSIYRLLNSHLVKVSVHV